MTGDEALPQRVLLIEDSEGDQRLVKELLAEANDVIYDVHAVVLLAEGIERGKREPWNVLILDMGLPDEDGLDAVRRVHFAVPDVPIVVLTGRQDESLAFRALQEGAQDYLLKG